MERILDFLAGGVEGVAGPEDAEDVGAVVAAVGVEDLARDFGVETLEALDTDGRAGVAKRGVVAGVGALLCLSGAGMYSMALALSLPLPPTATISASKSSSSRSPHFFFFFLVLLFVLNSPSSPMLSSSLPNSSSLLPPSSSRVVVS
jgi:hypothetical protein